MIKYIFKRLFLMIITLWFILTLTFISMYFMPGDPYPGSERMRAQEIENLDHQYGFDRPFAVQYADYFTNITGFSGLITTPEEGQADSMFGFTMGYSFSDTDDVTSVIAKAYPVSLTMGVVSVIIGTLIGIGLGIVAAMKKNSWIDYLATLIAVIGVSFPSFVLAAYFQYFLANQLNLFPTAYYRGNILSMVLPIAALSVFAISQVARVTRTEMIEVLGNNYITLAEAKGLTHKKVIFKHAFRNILVSIVTILGPITVGLTTGSLVIESIFSIPGLGSKFTPAVTSCDFYLVLGTTLVLALQILVMYLIVDILYVFIDPRIKLEGGKHE